MGWSFWASSSLYGWSILLLTPPYCKNLLTLGILSFGKGGTFPADVTWELNSETAWQSIIQTLSFPFNLLPPSSNGLPRRRYCFLLEFPFRQQWGQYRQRDRSTIDLWGLFLEVQCQDEFSALQEGEDSLKVYGWWAVVSCRAHWRDSRSFLSHFHQRSEVSQMLMETGAF